MGLFIDSGLAQVFPVWHIRKMRGLVRVIPAELRLCRGAWGQSCDPEKNPASELETGFGYRVMLDLRLQWISLG
jgi:hypothetical protein